MARVHELLIKIDGKLNGSVNSAFKSVANKATNLDKQFKNLKKVKLGAEKFKTMESGLEKLEGKLKNTREKTLELRRAFNDSKARTEALAKEFKNTGGKSEELAKKLAKSREETSRLNEKYQKSKASMDAVNSKIQQQKAELDSLSGSLSKAGFKTNDFAKSQKKLAAKMSIQENYGSMKENFGKAGTYAKSAMKRTAAFGAAAAVPLKFAIDEESVNAEIAKVADFANDKQKKEVTDSLKKMITTEIPMSYQEIGELAAAGAQGGIETVDLSKFSELAAKMGVAFDMEAGEAGQKMANWKAAFGMDMDELKALGDKVNYLGNNSAASAASISNVISRVGALGEVAGVGSGEVAGLGAAMIAMGTDDDVAATGIKKVLTTLASGGNKASKAILGIGGADLSKAMKADGAGTIIDVFEKIKALNPEEQTGALRDIFGQQNIGAIAPLLNNLDLVKEYLGMVGDKSKYAGSMQQEFEAQAGTTANQLKILGNQAKDAGMVVGGIMLPYFQKGVEKLQEFALKAKAFAEEHPKMMEAILKIAGVIAGLAVAVPIVLSLYNAFKTLGLAFKIVKSLVGLLMANPMVAGIMLAVAAVILLWKNWDKVKAVAGAAMDWVNSKIEAGKAKVGELKAQVAEKFAAMKQHFVDAGNSVKNFFLAPLNKAKEIVGRIKEGVGGIASNIKNKVSSGVQKLTGGGSSVPAMATGGVVTGPQMTLIGEGGDHEAVIPLNRNKRSQALWEYAGNRMGLLGRQDLTPNYNLASVGGGSSPVNITIAVDARGGGNEANIRNAISESIPELKRVVRETMDEVSKDRRRRAFT
ncbi:phage tail tape measure protein [uncultured Peptoniphilus sp.]|uniref:phage tail tape measure protein n=1 Tax=uncultured Peptoniphilus sp. TaxID=254354 RepID=UPI002597CF77|nr:phage tail tape measure protein [uncultured Peptoniphilus sp.]